MNTDTSNINHRSSRDAVSIDELFSAARSHAIEASKLDDDNFTKIVINSLPENLKRSRSRKYYPDLVGLLVGLIAALLVIDPSQIFNTLLGLFPDSISISLTNMLIASFGFSCLAALAWWSVESNQAQTW
jgi:hypothetical protein